MKRISIVKKLKIPISLSKFNLVSCAYIAQKYDKCMNVESAACSLSSVTVTDYIKNIKMYVGSSAVAHFACFRQFKVLIQY